MNQPDYWFTTEDVTHIPGYHGQSKVEAMNNFFNNSERKNHTLGQTNGYDKNNIINIINAGEAKGIDSLTRSNNPKKFNEMVNWIDLASGTHNIEFTRRTIDEYLK